LQGGDPHTITAYVSPNTGRPMGLFAESQPQENWLALIDLQGLLSAPRNAGVLPNGSFCRGCTHSVDPNYDLLAHGVETYFATHPVFTVSPNSGERGQQSQSVNLSGHFTHWTQGITTASFGSGITVVSLSVTN